MKNIVVDENHPLSNLKNCKELHPRAPRRATYQMVEYKTHNMDYKMGSIDTSLPPIKHPIVKKVDDG